MDFSGQMLAALKYKNPDARILKIQARSVRDFLSAASGIDPEIQPDHACTSARQYDSKDCLKSNLAAFVEALDQFTLDDISRRELGAILIEEDAFGAHLGPAFGEGETSEDGTLGDDLFQEGKELLSDYEPSSHIAFECA
jgi:hypothetical protein